MSCGGMGDGSGPWRGWTRGRAFRRKSDGWLSRDDRCEAHRAACNDMWEPAAQGLLGRAVTVQPPPWADPAQCVWRCQPAVDAITRVSTFMSELDVVAAGTVAVVSAVSETSHDWVQVVLADGRLGWVAAACRVPA